MTNAELAVLSLITERARHGYEIEQVIEERGMREWTEIGFSSIYYVLARLEKRGLVESRVESRQGQGPNRRLFHPTPAGRQAFRSAVYDALSTLQPVASPFMLGLGILPALEPAEALTALSAYRTRLAKRLVQVAERRRAQGHLVPDFVDALFERTQVLIRAELDWLDRFIQRQKEGTRTMSVTLDLTRLHKGAYTARAEPSLVSVPTGNFLTIEGRGEPGGGEFTQALEALYSTCYTLKFRLKAEGLDFKVGVLEGLWYGGPEWQEIPRERWPWKLMIRQPDYVTSEAVESAVTEVVRKKKNETARQLKLEVFDEGLAAQIMHLGPYSEELPTIERLHAFIAGSGYEPVGTHHEIYLSDPNRTAPEKMKTILRHPVRMR